ncbi:type ISP restriction/modification enzyme [uncultured Actinomyces sp.]|uniref:type ISP restriction/modification enzyme n=1 Tax=uncultured Actinomyces sp. TaxID=249061 RepID=UPI0015B8E568|nr:type ISP restriction/modification enzyme [uncultured Actinomyces sp.]
MNHLIGQGFSQRLACRVAGLSRSAYCRARAAGGAKTLRDHGPVRQWMNDCAATHRRWGYKPAWARAKSEGIVVGRDTFRRLGAPKGLRVRARKAHKTRTAPHLQHLVRASVPGQVWLVDFQFDSDWKGRVLKVCNVIDEFTRQHLALRVERRMGAADVIEMLDLAVLTHGTPQVLRADNGPEFIAAAMGGWASKHDTLQAFIPPGQPWLGGFVESLHNRMRDELLEDNMFEDLSPASSSEPDLFADLATASESTSDGAATASSLDFSRPIGDQIPVILDGYRRVDNVTDATLTSYREHYGDAGITKEDIFFYVYALLHHPEYRERYEDDLKKMLPHIPRAAGFHTYASVGRELADLHVNYERVEPYPSVQEEASLHAPADPWERYRIGERKMRFPALGRRDKDVTRLEYNDYMTLTGIPAEAQGYSISGRSPLEWIIDRYHVKTDKASGIVNDPNDFLREQGRPDAVVDLIKRLVTVSMRTQELLKTLPPLEIPEVQG